MSTVQANPVPVVRHGFGTWLREAGRLFRLAPFMTLLFPFLPMVVEGIIQLGVPQWGVILSKCLTTIASVMMLAIMHERYQSGRIRLLPAIRLARHRTWAIPVIIALALLVFGSQILMAWGLAGASSATALATGDAQHLGMSRGTLGLVLASGIVVTTPLMFISGALVLTDASTSEAVRFNILAIRQQAVAVVAFGLTAALWLYASIQWPILLIAFIPAVSTISYAGWRVAMRSTGVH